MADLGESWTTQQLVEFLSLVSSFPDEQAAIRGAVERAAEALEAEVGAVVTDSQVLASTGFPADDVPTALLIAAAEGKVTTIEVPGAGASATISVPLEDGMSGRLVLARGGGEVFSRQEANLLRGMGRVLALTLNFRGERAQRERSEKQALENAKLLATLQERQGELKLIGELERAALLRPDWERLTQDVVERVGLHLQVDHCAVLAYEPENHQLRMIAAVGWPGSFVGHLTVPATNDTQGGRTFNSEEPVIVDDLATDKRFPGSETLREHGILSGVCAPIRGQSQPYGGSRSTRPTTDSSRARRPPSLRSSPGSWAPQPNAAPRKSGSAIRRCTTG